MASVFAGELQKSHNDKREYRYLTLPNRLSVVLVHDKDTEKSSACVDVKVGAMADPEDMPGLAHFLEHMLFLGTETYPTENAYSSYLNAHGGHSNAYTDQEDTVYYFDVLNHGFDEALNMFASFFTCPLFTESATARETNAVDSENQKNLQSDTWRHYQLLKSMAREGHPFRSFSTGNSDTLLKIPEAAGKNPRDIVIEFYHKYYSSNIMKLVVYGKEPLDELQKMVEEKFAKIPDKSLSPPRVPGDAFGKAQLGKLLEVVPVRDSKNLDLYFPMPPVEHLYLSKPMRCLSHLIGHESGGSILSALKSRGQGWANGLSASLYASYTDFACFNVSIELTDEGMGHVDDIVSCVFSYIGMLLREGPKEWIGAEYKDICDMNFRFLEKTEPSQYVVRLANNMQTCAAEHTISGTELIFTQDMAASWKYLHHMTPDQCLIVLKNKGFAGKTTLKEKWYGTDYNEKALESKEQLQRWSACLRDETSSIHINDHEWKKLVYLPQKNPFVPTDFAIRCESSSENSVTATVCSEETEVSVPTLLEKITTSVAEMDDEKEVVKKEGEVAVVAENLENLQVENNDEEEDEEEDDEEEEERTGVMPPPPGKVLTSWFLQDTTWKVPKVNLLMAFEHILAFSTPLGVAFTDVFACCLKEVLNEYSYYADCAGLQYDVRVSKGGFELMFYGYHHKLPVLVQKVLEEMKSMATGATPTPPELYGRMKEKALRSLYNTNFQQPYYHALIGTVVALEEPRWTAEEKFTALTAATLSDFHSFSSQLLRCLKAEVLVHGNASEEEAKRLTSSVREILQFLPLPPSQEPIRRSVALVPGTQYIYRQHSRSFNPKEPNSAVENVYLMGEVAGKAEQGVDALKIGDEAMLELLAHLISEPAFDQLRTKEQLGYIVHTAVHKIGSSLALRMVVQSSHKDPEYLDQRVEDFLIGFEKHLMELSNEEFQKNVTAVIDKLTEKSKNLDQETGRFWAEVRGGWALFDRRERVATHLKSSTLTQCISFFQRYIIASSSTASRKKVTSQFFGRGTSYPKKDTNEGKIVLITDPSAFKRSMILQPVATYF